MSTISVALAERLAVAHGEAGGSYVSAPVFGRPVAAREAETLRRRAGPSNALDIREPAFSAIGQRTFRVGDAPPAANLIKLCGNFMIMSAIEALAEAMTLAAKGGVEKKTLLDVLTSTLFTAPVYQTYGDILVEERFKPAGFAAPLGLKDMNLAAAAAERSRTPMPFLGVIRDHLLSAIAQEGEDIDWAAIGRVAQRNAGF